MSRLELNDPQDLFLFCTSVTDKVQSIRKRTTTLQEMLANELGQDEDDLPKSTYPLSFKTIARAQNKDTALLKCVKTDTHYKVGTFRHGGETPCQILLHDGKIVIPRSLQRRCVEWYHEILMHPGETRTELTIRQHYWWNNLRDNVIDVCRKCDSCQRSKAKTIKYGHLPAKNAETVPWETLCVDLIGPYTIKRKGKSPLTLYCLTMIDPATSWFEIVEIRNKTSLEVANKADFTWFMRYPWPSKVILDRGREFMGEFKNLLKNEYGIKRKPITTRNPQANAIVERVHQTIGNMIRTVRMHSNPDIDDDDPWTGVLSAVAFGIRATVHTTTRATPAQLVFGRDMILNIRHEANWNYIRQRKQLLIDKNNAKENARRKPYKYKVGEQILLTVGDNTKYGSDKYEGPHTIVKVNDNGTVQIWKGNNKKGAVYQTYNIRQIYPYKD